MDNISESQYLLMKIKDRWEHIPNMLKSFATVYMHLLRNCRSPSFSMHFDCPTCDSQTFFATVPVHMDPNVFSLSMENVTLSATARSKLGQGAL